jgi:hypothetical protein
MTEYNYRVIVTKENGKQIKLAAAKCHDAKSLAGTLFHDEKVKSVFVCDKLANHYLYLVKGHPEKTENVPSEVAHFG